MWNKFGPRNIRNIASSKKFQESFWTVKTAIIHDILEWVPVDLTLQVVDYNVKSKFSE